MLSACCGHPAVSYTSMRMPGGIPLCTCIQVHCLSRSKLTLINADHGNNADHVATAARILHVMALLTWQPFRLLPLLLLLLLAKAVQWRHAPSRNSQPHVLGGPHVLKGRRLGPMNLCLRVSYE